MAEPVAFTLNLTLPDYFELRAYYQRRYVVRNSLYFLGFLLVGAVVIPSLSGLPMRLMLLVAERNWTYYATVIVGVFLLARLLPFFSVASRWLRGKLPRRMSVVVTEVGVRYTLFDTDVLLRWAAIYSVVITPRAYFINAEGRIVRLPKSEIPSDQSAGFEALVRQHTALKIK